MPLVNAETYTPKAGEPAMMDMPDRSKAAEAHYRELEADGKGRLIALPDDRLWWVPTDMGELSIDLATVLGNPVLGQLMAAVLANIVDAATTDAAKRVLVMTDAKPRRTSNSLEDEMAVEPTATQALLDVAMRMERTHVRMVAALEMVTAGAGERAEKAQVVEPLPKFSGNPRQSVIDELGDLGFTDEEGPIGAYTADETPYISLHNGVKVGDKQPVVSTATPQEAVKATIDSINRMATDAGLTHIIWRQYPELQRRNDGFVVRCRLAFGMSRGA